MIGIIHSKWIPAMQACDVIQYYRLHPTPTARDVRDRLSNPPVTQDSIETAIKLPWQGCENDT